MSFNGCLFYFLGGSVKQADHLIINHNLLRLESSRYSLENLCFLLNGAIDIDGAVAKVFVRSAKVPGFDSDSSEFIQLKSSFGTHNTGVALV